MLLNFFANDIAAKKLDCFNVKNNLTLGSCPDSQTWKSLPQKLPPNLT